MKEFVVCKLLSLYKDAGKWNVQILTEDGLSIIIIIIIIILTSVVVPEVGDKS